MMQSAGRKIFKEIEISRSLASESCPFLNRQNQTIFPADTCTLRAFFKKISLTYPV